MDYSICAHMQMTGLFYDFLLGLRAEKSALPDIDTIQTETQPPAQMKQGQGDMRQKPERDPDID
jgi:hypothetical protein